MKCLLIIPGSSQNLWVYLPRVFPISRLYPPSPHSDDWFPISPYKLMLLALGTSLNPSSCLRHSIKYCFLLFPYYPEMHEVSILSIFAAWCGIWLSIRWKTYLQRDWDRKKMCNNFSSGVDTLKHNPAPHRDVKLFFCGGNHLHTWIEILCVSLRIRHPCSTTLGCNLINFWLVTINN